MRLFQIEYMMAVSRNGSISKAADELLVSRPAVSKALSSWKANIKYSCFQERRPELS
jgi:DNA-binding transcriptional LysR family regulator